MRRGSPTTIRVASFSLAMAASRAARVACGSALTVVSACAMVPVGSLNASPTRFDPGSTASTRKLVAGHQGYGEGEGDAAGVGLPWVALAALGAPSWTT